MLKRTRPRGPAAEAANKARIRALGAEASSDLEVLARMFEDDGIVDDGTVSGRLRALLQATGRRTIPGLQTAVPFGDSGFAGDRRPGGAGFRDPWPASRNQVGHFLTAVGLSFAPDLVSRRIPILGSIRAIVAAPDAMSDAEVALRLAIGHEKVADPPNPLETALLALAKGLVEARWTVAVDLSPRQRAGRIATAVVVEALRQTWGSITTFREQFQATTTRDVSAWNAALRRSGNARAFDRRAVDTARGPLRSIAVSLGEGNSVQDLRLTLVGWRLGRLIAQGAFRNRAAVARWIRRALG